MLTIADEGSVSLCESVPDAPESPTGGQPVMSNCDALHGIFGILNSGVYWDDPPPRIESNSAMHR